MRLGSQAQLASFGTLTLKLLTRAHHSIKMLSAPDGAGPWVSHVQQWRNVISEGPRFKIFEGPLVEVPKQHELHL